MQSRPPKVSVGQEFASAKLGNSLRTTRAVRIADRLQLAPGRSLPRLFGDPSELEAVYRFFSNQHVSSQGLLDSHSRATAERVRACTRVVVAHDSSELRYFGDREGLGHLQNGQGFLIHASLAFASRGEMPLGLLALQALVPEASDPKTSGRKRSYKRRSVPREEKRSARWDEGVRAASAVVGPETSVELIHVMDQEADQYALLAFLLGNRHRFIVRGKPIRTLNGRDGEKVGPHLQATPVRMEREVPLSARSAKVKGRTASRNQGQAPRAARVAQLEVRAERIKLKRPAYAQTEVKEFEVNAVYVSEPEPPEGEEPLEWLLYTSEPIETLDELRRTLDEYCLRWGIEEYFKALKTGCAMEKRQLTSQAGLERALALFAAVAWQLLLVRYLAWTATEQDAEELFEPVRLKVLKAISERVKLGEHPTAREVYLAIAGLGGHLRQNGEPGWQTLGAGYEDLLRAELVWNAATQAAKPDQS